ncbi:hypothetical protein B484DRAFT_6762 [Ochromonadaceae sp. CCMP2298]|nr:hypothetical protein B484DRAFT_6762 [Ochromonadaceae sp. CCMP2298]
MQRTVFERTPIEGYRTAKTEGIAVTSHGRRMFAGTSDGSVLLYECRPDNAARYSCAVVDTIRKSRERKPAAQLTCVESWRALLCIVDGLVTAFDSQFYQPLGAITEQKGCHCFAVHEAGRFLLLAHRKKLMQYAWQGGQGQGGQGQASCFQLLREFTLADSPQSLLCCGGGAGGGGGCVIVGYRRHYECLDLLSGTSSRILDVEKEHKLVALEVGDI